MYFIPRCLFYRLQYSRRRWQNMEKSHSSPKKKTSPNAYSNQYSYLNLKTNSHDKLNCLSVDLERLRKNGPTLTLPALTTERKNLIKIVSEKLRLLKQKIKDREEPVEVIKMESIMPMPIPMQMPMPMQPMGYPFPYPPMGCCHQCNHKEPKKPRKRTKKQKKPQPQPQPPKPKKSNKFRIYAYAVYFSIYIKHYSQRFTENRKKWFMDRYSHKDGGIIYQGSEQVLRKLHDLDLYQMSLDAKVTKHISGETIVDWQQYTKTALIPANSTQRSGLGKDTISQYIINFTDMLLEKIGELILDEDFIKEYHEVFSVGSLDLSFMVDNLYLPEEVPFLFVHPTKGYLRLSYQEEIQLLLVKVMIKMVIFNYLLGLRKSKSWSKKLEHQYKLAQFQVEEMWEIARTIAIYLYLVCKDIYVTGIRSLKHDSNFYQLCKTFGVRQAKHLEESSVPQNLEQNAERRFELIRNIKNFQMTQQKINKNSRLTAYKSILQQKIVTLLDNLYQKIKKQQRDLYAYIKNMTLAVPYLIFDSINRNKQQQSRKNKQYKILKPGNMKQGKAWNQIYGARNGNNSISSDKSKSKNVKFDDSHQGSTSKHTSKENRHPMGKMVAGRINHEDNSNRDTSHFSEQGKNNKEIDNGDIGKSYEMKKPFNVDTVNGKYDENRQDRLRQKFRNLLAKNQQQNAS